MIGPTNKQRQKEYEVEELRAYRHKTPLNSMFSLKGSIIFDIMAEYFGLVIINLTLNMIIGLQKPSGNSVLAVLKKATQVLDSFSLATIMFPLSFVLAIIHSVRIETFFKSIILIESFAAFLLVHIPSLELRQEILDYVQVMIMTQYEHMTDDFSIYDVTTDPRYLDKYKEFRRNNKQRSVRTDQYWFVFKIYNLLNKQSDRDLIYPKLQEMADKLADLINIIYRRLPFKTLSTVIFCCNIGLIQTTMHTVLGSLSGKSIIGLLELLSKLFMFYAWPKMALQEYHPFGVNTEQINLYNLSRRNIDVGERMFSWSLTRFLTPLPTYEEAQNGSPASALKAERQATQDAENDDNRSENRNGVFLTNT